MGKSKTPKGLQNQDNGVGTNNQLVCNACQSKNPINLVCTDQKCDKQEQLQAICATCHYSLYHSSVSLETYLKKISLIFQESLAILEIDQKKLLQFQESLNQTYFMIENLKLKTYEYLQEQENQRQQLLSLIQTIKNLEETKQPSPQMLKDKVRELSKILILDPKASEENPLRTTMNFYREFVYQCEMEIWIKFNRYFSQRRDWVVKTEEEIESLENGATHHNNHGHNVHLALMNGNGNLYNTLFNKNDQQLRLNGQRDNKKDLLYGNQSQMETENIASVNNNKYYDINQNKRPIGDETEDSKEDEEDCHFEIERNPDEFSDKSENEEDGDEEDDDGEEEDEQDDDYQYKQRRRKQSQGNNGSMNNQNGNYANGYHSQRTKSNSAYHRYQGNSSNNNDYHQSSSHSNNSTGVPKVGQATIRKIRDLTPKEKTTILQEFDQSGDIRKISEKYKIKYRRLYNFIQNSRGPNNQSIRQYSDEDKQLIYLDYLETKNVREVANKWKLNYDSLYSFIRYKKQK